MYKTKVAKVSNFQAKCSTHPSLTILFTPAVKNVGKGWPISVTRVPVTDGVLAAAVAQDNIGWINFVLDRSTPQWLTVQ